VSTIEALEKQLAAYRLLDETSDAIPFRLAPDLSRLLYVGPQAERLLGIAQAHWLVPGFLDARLSDEQRAATLEQFRIVIEFGASHEAEFRLLRDDGSWAWIRCTMRAFDGMVAGHLLDITLRQRLTADHAQLQRLEAVGRLASGIAHEINTPLQFIGHSLEFLGEALQELLPGASAELRADSEEALARCNEGIERVTALVRSMRTFVHAGAPQKTPADLADLLRSAIAISASEHRAVASIVTELAAIPKVRCFPGELGQVFLNLIVNAAQAIAETKRRGTITVSTRVDGDAAVIAIADTGGGIPEHARARVFEPFFTTKEIGRGTGQGLAIARAVLDRHAGSIDFTTELGRGTTFTVRLPLTSLPA